MNEMRWKGYEVKHDTECVTCAHPFAFHNDGMQRKYHCTDGGCGCLIFLHPEERSVSAQVSGQYDAKKLAEDLGYQLNNVKSPSKAEDAVTKAQVDAAGYAGILEVSLKEKCNFCLHLKENFKKNRSGTFTCMTRVGPSGYCGCEYCYCDCTHRVDQHSRSQVGCKVENCKCDIGNIVGTPGTFPIIIEIDDYLRSFEMS